MSGENVSSFVNMDIKCFGTDDVSFPSLDASLLSRRGSSFGNWRKFTYGRKVL